MDNLSSPSMTPPAMPSTSTTEDKITMQDQEITTPSSSQDMVTPELELPVLRDRGNGEGGHGGGDENEEGNGEREGKNVIRSEIPDSEADTEDAVSPVKSVGVEAKRAMGVDSDGGQSPRGADGLQRGEREVQLGRNEDILDRAQPNSLVTEGDNENPERIQSTEPYATAKETIEGDGAPVPFIDNDSMIVLPEFTTSDLQPMTQEQTVLGDSNFKDAVAVMSDVGGCTQDVVFEDGVGDGGKVLEETLEEEKNDVQLVDVPASSPEETGAGAGSRMESGSAAKALEDGMDVVMSDESVLDQEKTENSEDKSSPESKNEACDVEMQQAPVSDVPSTTSTAARSIPDSDDDEELPDVPSPQKGTQEQVIASTIAANATVPSTVENAVANKRESQATQVSSSPPKQTNIPPKSSTSPTKTPNISFKAPTISKSTNSQPSESTSSPPKSEVPRSGADKLEEKSPTGSFKSPDGPQNKDILMAELKAMKIVCSLTQT